VCARCSSIFAEFRGPPRGCQGLGGLRAASCILTCAEVAVESFLARIFGSDGCSCRRSRVGGGWFKRMLDNLCLLYSGTKQCLYHSGRRR
jgi:hypothetical protein